MTKERRVELKAAALAAKKVFEEARTRLDRFPDKLQFVNLPIPDEYVLSDDIVEGLCREIESYIRDGKVTV